MGGNPGPGALGPGRKRAEVTRNAWPSQIKGWQVPVPSFPIQRPLLSVSHVLTSLVAKGPSCPAWDTEVKDACPGPQEAHSSWRTQSHKPLHYRECGTREERAQARGAGVREVSPGFLSRTRRRRQATRRRDRPALVPSSASNTHYVCRTGCPPGLNHPLHCHLGKYLEKVKDGCVCLPPK